MIGGIGFAFALVYRTTRVFHLALGGVYALTPFVLQTCIIVGLPVWLSVCVSIVVAVSLALLLEEVIHWPFSRKLAPSEVHLIGSLGAYFVLVQCIALIWGNESRVLRDGVDTAWNLLGVTLAQAQFLGATLTVIAVVVLYTWLSFAKYGLEFRALADNPMLVSLLGRNVRALRRGAFGLSAALVAVVSLAQAWDFGFDPYVGLKVVLLGMSAMIIGGTGSFIAPFIGGVLLGILRGEIVWFGSARWDDAATFVLLAAFLFFRPQGIFTRRMRLEQV